MKYDESVCKFNMDTGCVELRLRDGRKVSIDCIGVEDALDVTMAQRSELDYCSFQSRSSLVGPKLRSVKAEARKPPGVYSPASLT